MQTIENIGQVGIMQADRKLVARKMFRLRVYEAKGIEYQRLFEKIMQYRYSVFIPIKPIGRVGDRKNDGYIPTTGTYFQVYAPENPSSTSSAKKAAKKAAEDFQGLVKFWEQARPIKRFRFVFNDNYRGSTPLLEEQIAHIQETYDVNARVLLAKDLENEALKLSTALLIDVLNTPIPSPGPLGSVDFGILREVVNHVLQTKTPVTEDALLKAPDFLEKISFNGLTPGVASLLTYGSYQSEAVRDFFSKNSTFARQQLREHLAAMYGEIRAKLSAVVAQRQEIGDMVFFNILSGITPNDGDIPRNQAAALQEAALVVMAFYFEACDIFEEPNAVTG